MAAHHAQSDSNTCIDGSGFLATAAEGLDFAALVLAVADVHNPRPEGFLAVQGVEADAINRWCETGHREDPAWRDARHAGCSVFRIGPGEAQYLMPGMADGLVHVLPASLDHQQVWLLALGRRDTPFSDADRHRAALILRLEQLAFDQTAESDVGRLLLGNRDQLLHADPRTDAAILEAPARLTNLTTALRPVIAQRWPDGLPPGSHDAVLAIEGKPVWLRFTECAAIPGLPPHLYVETRPVAADDVPAVGLTKDDRIARAIAYLSDRYPDAPSLADVAAAVHVSAFHFHRLFTKEVGLSPKHFLLRTQLQAAKWRLRATRLPVGDIATRTGFASHGHFTATFHRFVGVSPTTYRERQ